MKKLLLINLFLSIFCIAVALAQGGDDIKLSAARAGQIGAPLGKIAFVREGDVWVMDWDGKNQFKVVAAQNADGRLSWAPDNRRIAFVRKGKVNLQGPDNLGGQHSIYDLFIGFLDSAKSNTNWWFRLTDDLGSRHPEWTADGSRIIFTKDINANTINALLPEYQTCSIDTTGKAFQNLTGGWKTSNRWVSMPSLGPNGYQVFVLFKDKNASGMVIAPPDLKGLSDDEIAQKAKYLSGATAPAWSPDGSWIAFIQSEMSKQGIYITKPDLSEKFLVYKPGPGSMMQTYPLSWSPDSKWITFGTGDGAIWIVDLTGNGLKQIVQPGLNFAPAWSKKK